MSPTHRAVEYKSTRPEQACSPKGSQKLVHPPPLPLVSHNRQRHGKTYNERSRRPLKPPGPRRKGFSVRIPRDTTTSRFSTILMTIARGRVHSIRTVYVDC